MSKPSTGPCQNRPPVHVKSVHRSMSKPSTDCRDHRSRKLLRLGAQTTVEGRFQSIVTQRFISQTPGGERSQLFVTQTPGNGRFDFAVCIHHPQTRMHGCPNRFTFCRCCSASVVLSPVRVCCRRKLRVCCLISRWLIARSVWLLSVPYL